MAYVQETAEAEGRPVSEQRTCRWLGVHRTPVRYVSRRAPDTELRERLRTLAAEHARWLIPRRDVPRLMAAAVRGARR